MPGKLMLVMEPRSVPMYIYINNAGQVDACDEVPQYFTCIYK